MTPENDCCVCGAALVYSEDTQIHSCHYCGEERESTATCSEGHFVCDACHSLSAMDLIERHCNASGLTDPLEMAMPLFNNPAVKMHGPEHHYLVPAVLLSAYYNKVGRPEEKEKKVAEARRRAEKVPGGFCGTHGNCGAAVGAGIFVSLVTGSTPLAGEEWTLSNRMTAEALLSIAEIGGPRCCKRTSLLAIVEGVRFAREHLGVEMDLKGDVVCRWSKSNRECIGVRCVFNGAGQG